MKKKFTLLTAICSLTFAVNAATVTDTVRVGYTTFAHRDSLQYPVWNIEYEGNATQVFSTTVPYDDVTFWDNPNYNYQLNENRYVIAKEASSMYVIANRQFNTIYAGDTLALSCASNDGTFLYRPTNTGQFATYTITGLTAGQKYHARIIVSCANSYMGNIVGQLMSPNIKILRQNEVSTSGAGGTQATTSIVTRLDNTNVGSNTTPLAPNQTQQWDANNGGMFWMLPGVRYQYELDYTVGGNGNGTQWATDDGFQVAFSVGHSANSFPAVFAIEEIEVTTLVERELPLTFSIPDTITVQQGEELALQNTPNVQLNWYNDISDVYCYQCKWYPNLTTKDSMIIKLDSLRGEGDYYLFRDSIFNVPTDSAGTYTYYYFYDNNETFWYYGSDNKEKWQYGKVTVIVYPPAPLTFSIPDTITVQQGEELALQNTPNASLDWFWDKYNGIATWNTPDSLWAWKYYVMLYQNEEWYEEWHNNNNIRYLGENTVLNIPTDNIGTFYYYYSTPIDININKRDSDYQYGKVTVIVTPPAETEAAPADTTVTLTWLPVPGTNFYIIIIYADASRTVPVFVILLNSNGDLYGAGVTRYAAPRAAGVSEQLHYTLNGLTEGTTYYYDIIASANEQGTDILQTYHGGSFTTTESGGVITGTVVPVSERSRTAAYYNLLGQKLLQEPASGVYIIVYDTGKVEKIVK
ncbi:MAG: hypothetical protein LBN27_13025 [Prevotellaceae bacterium]|jgi:hypothetical protein|nr:hypothetical protein [Prevotellaceae bacterium]